MSSAGNLPPATPAYVLRGHTVSVHALQFYKQNSFLISGDTDGWIVVWDLASKRSVACWRGHEGSVLGIKEWETNVITHGRDHRLRVWQLNGSSLDGESLDACLPAEGPTRTQRREPWLRHSMAVSALNFCAFALCAVFEAGDGEAAVNQGIIIAVPNALDSGSIDFFHLPPERRVSVLKADVQIKTGMVMGLDVFHHPKTHLLTVISGYEDGSTMVHQRKPVTCQDEKWIWEKILVSRPHSQPVLSLDTAPSREFYFTSSADALLAKFAIPTSSFGGDPDVEAARITNTKHAGQQDLNVRSDGLILATAGWDARIRVYSAKTLKELAVLKWHRDGCYSIAFAHISAPDAHAASAKEQLPVTLAESNDSALDVIKYQRSTRAQRTHWLAAGGKDGKISLWDIY